LGLPFYDPILIIQKTEGRMAGDNFWIRIEE
jgi:putative transcriptional regulator